MNKALKLNPNLAEAYGNRGLAEYALGNKRSAVADLQKAASIFHQQGDNQNYQQTQAIIKQFTK